MSDKKIDRILEISYEMLAEQRQAIQEMRAFRRETGERFDRVETHLEHMKERLDRIDARLDAFEAFAHQLARRAEGFTLDIVILKREAASLRQAITDYHGSVLGHGVLLTELEERLARVERHLNLRS